jgi:hypothetical protein
MRRKLIIEQVAKKCNIPKKMKLLGFMKKVTDVIIIQIDIKTLRRFRNFFLNLSLRIKIPKDIPEIIIKLAPTH